MFYVLKKGGRVVAMRVIDTQVRNGKPFKRPARFACEGAARSVGSELLILFIKLPTHEEE